jgi:enoyl-CoA hydratase
MFRATAARLEHVLVFDYDPPVTQPHALVEQDGHKLVVTMNRPEARNALSPDMLVGLADGYAYVDETPEIRCAILTGAGGHFSSGADLKAMGRPSDSEHVRNRMAETPNLHWKALLRDYRMTKPLIAAVEGYAVAGGTEMLQGTDIRIAGENATFGVWEGKRGLFPLGGSAVRLPRQIPYTIAMDILLSSKPVPATEALRIGLIGRVVPDGTALDAARAVAEQVAACGPLSTQAILRAWRETESMTEAEAMAIQDTIGWEVFASEDAQEGPRAFAEKRAPQYKGK